MKLKHEIKTVYKVHYKDLEDLIREEYNQPDFALVADLEARNGSTETFSFKKEEMNEFDNLEIEEFRRTGKGEYLTGSLMQDLVNRDIILEGEYVIEIYW